MGTKTAVSKTRSPLLTPPADEIKTYKLTGMFPECVHGRLDTIQPEAYGELILLTCDVFL